MNKLFAGMVILGCGTGELWDIPGHQKFDQQARVVQHFLYTCGIPMINCPRFLGLVKHDPWHVDVSPANKYALNAYVHTTVNLLQLGLVARTAWLLGQYGPWRSPLATVETLTDHVKIPKEILYEQETFLVTHQNASLQLAGVAAAGAAIYKHQAFVCRMPAATCCWGTAGC